MFSSTALVHRRSHTCRFVCNARLCGGITSVGFCLPSRVAHSLVWILPDCHGIVALLVISGKQPSSELLHTLRFVCVCVGHLSASVQWHLLHNTEALLVFQATFSRVSPSRLTSTTQPLATVPGYHNIQNTLNRRKFFFFRRHDKNLLIYRRHFCPLAYTHK